MTSGRLTRETRRRPRLRGSGVLVREVLRRDDPILRDAYRLLCAAFDKHELVSVLEWRDTLAERDAKVWIDVAWHLLVAERRGRILGVATGTYLGNANIGVIGYLAVHADARGLGLGPRLRRRLTTAFRRDAKRIRGQELAGVVGEVRHDNPWLRHLMRRTAVIALDFAYVQPGLRRGERPVPFTFYYEGIGTRRRHLAGAELRRLLYTIWRRVYRIARPMASPAFRRMMDELAGRRIVRALTRAEVAARAPARSGAGAKRRANKPGG